jgi:hypothetical protein
MPGTTSQAAFGLPDERPTWDLPRPGLDRDASRLTLTPAIAKARPQARNQGSQNSVCQRSARSSVGVADTAPVRECSRSGEHRAVDCEQPAADRPESPQPSRRATDKGKSERAGSDLRDDHKPGEREGAARATPREPFQRTADGLQPRRAAEEPIRRDRGGQERQARREVTGDERPARWTASHVAKLAGRSSMAMRAG